MNSPHLSINPSVSSKMALSRFLDAITDEEFPMAKLHLNLKYLEVINLTSDDMYGICIMNHLIQEPFDLNSAFEKMTAISEGDNGYAKYFRFTRFNKEHRVKKTNVFKYLDDHSKFVVSYLTSFFHDYLDIKDFGGKPRLSVAFKSFFYEFTGNQVEITKVNCATSSCEATVVDSEGSIFSISEIVVMGLITGGSPRDKNISDKIVDWFLSDDVGLSSKAMVSVAVGKVSGTNAPMDLGDLNRCMKLLRDVPEVRHHFKHIASLSPKWKKLIDNWNDLETLFHEEVGIDNFCGKQNTKTNELLKTLVGK